jgi:hypothetical protein
MFTIELLQAISDWQQGDPTQKALRGIALKSIAASLPDHFKTVTVPCYRKLAIGKGGVWALGTTAYLQETISAWTTSIEVCENFKGGVPVFKESKGKQIGTIFQIQPLKHGKVILNLETLFKDNQFNEFRNANKGSVNGYKYGMGKYEDRQKEVVIECVSIPLTCVFALGGFASADVAEISNIKSGYWLKTPEAIERVCTLLLEAGKTLKTFKDAQEKSP